MFANARKWLVLLIVCMTVAGIASGCTGSRLAVQESVSPSASSGPNTVTPGPNTTSPSASPSSAPSATPSQSPTPPPKEKVKAKGLYLTGWTAGDSKKLQKYIDLANTTEINAYVIDVKNDEGFISYASDVPAVQEAKAWEKKYNPEELIKKLHENNIYVIGRIVCFRDPIMSKKYPEKAVKTTDGRLWKEEKKDTDITWLNPYDRDNWDYILDIAQEAVQKGFDEIQFDYIRFPYGDRSKMDFGAKDFVKQDIINAFVSYARQAMPDVTLSADIFGITCESPGDTENIGQNIELIGKELDYISPMCYPALYALGQIVNEVKFPKPDLEPYGVVYNSLVKAKSRISKVEEYRADVRPFIQAFTASWLKAGTYQQYGVKQYKEQIQAVHDAGYEQWIFWDANNRYDFSAFDKE